MSSELDSSKGEALLILSGWQDSGTLVSLRIASESTLLEGFAGWITKVNSEGIAIGSEDLALWIDISSASNFTWSPVEKPTMPDDLDFDPLVTSQYESVLRFESNEMTFSFGGSK